MSTSKLKIRTGPHEFEAEGDGELVMQQFELFRKMIAPEAVPRVEESSTGKTPEGVVPLPLNKLFRVGSKLVALNVTARPEDAVLMMILGQKHFLKNENVSGGDIMEGLRQSGIRVPRADLMLGRHADRGLVVMSGKRRNRRYRLSAAGMDRAQHIARTLISMLPPEPKPE